MREAGREWIFFYSRNDGEAGIHQPIYTSHPPTLPPSLHTHTATAAPSPPFPHLTHLTFLAADMSASTRPRSILPDHSLLSSLLTPAAGGSMMEGEGGGMPSSRPVLYVYEVSEQGSGGGFFFFRPPPSLSLFLWCLGCPCNIPCSSSIKPSPLIHSSHPTPNTQTNQTHHRPSPSSSHVFHPPPLRPPPR